VTKGTAPWSTWYIGHKYGLRLTLDLQTQRYTGQSTATVGARVTLHGANEAPHPEIAGFNAPPGQRSGWANVNPRQSLSHSSILTTPAQSRF